MDETELQRFRQQLLRLKTELLALEESSAAAGRPVELDQTRVGRLSRMDAMQGQQMAQEAARRRQQRLRAIAGALRRIDSGDFGHCTVCGEEIDRRRLDFDPTNARCVECAE
jgi:DnaK suppressor protein